jgi:Triosephosphate isomerase
MRLTNTIVAALAVANTSAYNLYWPSTARYNSVLWERKPFITGNWKLNPQSKQEAISLATGIADAVQSSSPADVAIFVPFPFIEAVQKSVGTKVIVGAQVRILPIRDAICYFHKLT